MDLTDKLEMEYTAPGMGKQAGYAPLPPDKHFLRQLNQAIELITRNAERRYSWFRYKAL